MSLFVDISKFQGAVNFSKMCQTTEGVILRCGYAGKKDIKFEDYYTEAKKQGIPIGSYHYATFHYSGNSTNLTAVEKAKAQAQLAIMFLKGKTINTFVALDLELEKGTSTVLSKNALTEAANAYMDEIKKAGYTPCLYCSISWLYDRMNVQAIKYPLWIAYYHKSGFTSADFPATSYGMQMKGIKDKIWLWQYTSEGKGSTYGVSTTHVDLNHCYKTFNNSSENKFATTARTYVVKSGDTLSAIALKYGISYKVIASYNCISNPNKIYVGQVLKIPGATSSTAKVHTVKSGENLSSIASKYGTTYQTLAKINGISNPNIIYPGQQIKIP